MDYSEIDNMFDESTRDVGTCIRLHTKIEVKPQIIFEIPNIIYDFDIFIILKDNDLIIFEL